MSNISKERLRKLLEALEWYQDQCASFTRYMVDKKEAGQLAVIRAIELDAGNRAKEAIAQLAAIDDITDGKGEGVDLDKLQKKFDKFFAEETEESFNEWLRMKGYLKSPFYCQNDIEDNGICNKQCDHCKAYYKPLDDQSPSAIDKGSIPT